MQASIVIGEDMEKKKINPFTLYIFASLMVLFVILISIIFKSSWFATISGILGLLTVIFQAHGKILGQIIGIIDSLSYGIFAYSYHYYGETIVYIFILIPILIYGIFSWSKHKDNSHILPNSIKPKEIIIITIFSLILGYVIYVFLKIVGTNNVILNTVSMLTLTIANYLIARRNICGFLFLIVNDTILLSLWLITFLSLDQSVLSFILCVIINLINDTIGFFNWLKFQKKRILSK